MFGDKVSEIEFHITAYEIEDFIVRAAKLVKDGYKVKNIRLDDFAFSIAQEIEPPIHITFKKEKK